ncbi:riboflavin synthase [Liquorilactobacillus satsumensis]|uniref:Riboflavin synthase n=1 Tax=Liquorilactobacillus satsumensis DSM 16230 = JCM 12392 TaxID=1423801 RepID=A0A0R1V794_9LACO|nr:riboflavin synthase [Liquorilactobacillus satsumensis]KRL98869.1 riboflavin synthase subunit alpha [Liquorilactobacillus satsumensis DSM 16230 = JCM 12392]MCP9327948.1 riboflavin synthase [Liquorilactobacillus satsumensis]
MFTGIITGSGQIVAIERQAEAARITIQTNLTQNNHSQLGDSIAVDGICLTVSALVPQGFTVDVMPETLRRTNLAKIQVGGTVNLELALLPTTRLAGHFVTGHVDTKTQVCERISDQNAVILTFRLPSWYWRYVVEKGSLAVNGVSLTVCAVTKQTFSVSLIPFTLKNTNLGALAVGDFVNIEVDILGKYILKQEGVQL